MQSMLCCLLFKLGFCVAFVFVVGLCGIISIIILVLIIRKLDSVWLGAMPWMAWELSIEVVKSYTVEILPFFLYTVQCGKQRSRRCKPWMDFIVVGGLVDME